MIPIPRSARSQRWVLWQLADDRETYGDEAGGFIIVTEDGEQEIYPGPAKGWAYHGHPVPVWHDETEPQAIIDAHNAEMAAIQNR